MTGIYARQSVDKKDSISIETQIEFCKRSIMDGENPEIYIDKGYSGSNTKRPQFQQLSADIGCGKISRVIVYKLDRISRSLMDFANIIDLFEKHNVEFISMTEKFDTSTPIGKAMLNIVMVFAQLERETIQKRVRDNFYERGRQGLFLSGVAPLGFLKIPTEINGIKTHKLQADPIAAPLIQLIYEEYSNPYTSVGSIVKLINSDLKHFCLDKPLNNVRVSRILRNPIYVRADADVYAYLQGKGAVMNDDISLFDGTHGCTVYGERKSKTKSKFTDLHGDFIKLNQHEGIIDAEKWLAVQKKMDSNRQLKNSGKGTHSWLSGLARCGYCGLALSVVNGQKNGKRYVNCGGRKQKFCYERKMPATFDDIESAVERDLLGYISTYKFTNTKNKLCCGEEINRIKIEMQKIDGEISAVIEKMLLANEVMAEYLNLRIKSLDEKKKEFSNRLVSLNLSETEEISDSDIGDYISCWNALSIEEKKIIAGYFIKSVSVTDGEIMINYKISL